MARRTDSGRQLDIGALLRPDALTTVLPTSAARALRSRIEAGAGFGTETGFGTEAGSGPPSRRSGSPTLADEVARWFVEQVPAGRFPAVVLGSPHASAVHLALALGVPWLPASFDLPLPLDATAVPDLPAVPDVAAAGAGPAGWLPIAERLAGTVGSAPGEIDVRVVVDPVRARVRDLTAGYAIVRWRRLPAAYRNFLAGHLQPGAPVILVRDVARWPTVRGGPQWSVQLGSGATAGGPAEYDDWRHADWYGRCADDDSEHAVDGRLVQDVRAWGSAVDRGTRQVLYRGSHALSAAVADLYRQWLRHGGRTGNRLAVECGRLFEPWEVFRSGLVPYWCEHPHGRTVRDLEWWLAGSEPFSSIEIFVEPPRVALPITAPLAQWLSAARFAGRQGAVDGQCAQAYPLNAVRPDVATSALRRQPYDLPFLPALDPAAALRSIGEGVAPGGLVVV